MLILQIVRIRASFDERNTFLNWQRSCFFKDFEKAHVLHQHVARKGFQFELKCHLARTEPCYPAFKLKFREYIHESLLKHLMEQIAVHGIQSQHTLYEKRFFTYYFLEFSFNDKH